MDILTVRGIVTGVLRRYWIGIVAAIVAFLAIWTTVIHIEPGRAVLAWNPFQGEVELIDHAGWHTKTPWTFTTLIDVRPQRLCLTSGAHAAANCRLAQFDTAHYREFVAVEGWHWYWWSNRLSINMGYQEEYRGWRDVMRGYTFAAQRYPFIKIMEE